MLIRPMEPEDIKAVAAIESQSFSMPWSQNGFMEALKMEHNIILVADEDGEILGYECIYVSFEEGELTNIAVKKEFRRSGIGQLLIRELQKSAASSGVERIVLEARESNDAAIGLYEKMGFAKLGIRKNFYEKPVENAVILSYTAEDYRC